MCIISIALKAFMADNFYQFLSWAYYASLFITMLAGFAGIAGYFNLTPDTSFLIILSINVVFLVFSRMTERKND